MKTVYKIALVGLFVGQFAFTNLQSFNYGREGLTAAEYLARDATDDAVSYYHETINPTAYRSTGGDYAVTHEHDSVERTDRIYSDLYNDKSQHVFIWMFGISLFSLLPALGMAVNDLCNWIRRK
ncbi:hypothetical protein [Klebsiella quasipneumoniae]|uniref:hypothetical protein n=1 Tax=Klebsiella quasipneumoniae TaxID=1463165 RepID=UPI000A26E055|nr:hypothetical protein [Klebsiella quasipneumoniae]MBC5182678.1 hypothetical protein [Klebsiella quasipneumoniae]MCW9408711.1 hypothetical protein [Klebsiella quasipneumoniae]HDG7890726.1 hypothetical protein [Klebsiella quasipneumoniae]